MVSPPVVAGALVAVSSATCVALAHRGDARPARLLAAAIAATALVGWLVLTRGSFADPTRLGEATLIALAVAAPALATLLLMRPLWWRRVLAVAACVVALPALASGLVFFARGLWAQQGALALTSLVALQIVATVAAGARALLVREPTSPAP